MEQFGKSPCGACGREACEDMDCRQWQHWFLEAWGAVHAYAWARMDEQGRQEPACFHYELPHLRKSPCARCVCRNWCDTPCSQRIAWWDACVGRK